jgi:hypothetical protein
MLLLDISLRLLRQPRKFRLNLLAPLFDLLAALNDPRARSVFNNFGISSESVARMRSALSDTT